MSAVTLPGSVRAAAPASMEKIMTTGSSRDRLGWASTLLGGFALVLAVVSVVQSGANRDLQQSATAAQAQLQKTQTLSALDNNLVQLLAKTAAEGNDSDIRALLAQNGITFRTRPADAAPPAPPAN